MNFCRRLVLSLLVVGLVGTSGRAAEPSPTEVAQMLVKRYAKAIVAVNLVVEVSGSAADKVMPPREFKLDALATLISADGMAMVSLGAIDPGELLDGMRINTPKGPVKFELSRVDYKHVKLRLPDGTEVPARVVLKDPDLDVAFIKLLTPIAAPLDFVDLKNDAVPELLSTGYILGRSSRATQSSPLVRRSDINSIVTKPRRKYVPEVGQDSCPMFDAKGRIYGLCVRLQANGRTTGTLVLPAADIAEIAEQAAAMKVEPEAVETEAPQPTTGG